MWSREWLERKQTSAGVEPPTNVAALFALFVRLSISIQICLQKQCSFLLQIINKKLLACLSLREKRAQTVPEN